MDHVVPPDVAAELVQILNALMSSDNKNRSAAEKTINDRLAQLPDLYLLALSESSIAADLDVIRSFSFILLRRFLFRSSQSQNATQASGLTLFDQITSDTLLTIKRLLLHSLSHESSPSVRRTSVDVMATLANKSMQKGRPWYELQAAASSISQSANAVMRESAFRLIAESTKLFVSLQVDNVLSVLKGGLEDGESIIVRFQALCAASAYISSSNTYENPQVLSLLYPMLNTLLSAPQSQMPKFLWPLSILSLTHPTLFQPHLESLLSFLAPLIAPNTDTATTPTEANPNQNKAAFTLPPLSSDASNVSSRADKAVDTENADAREPALEFLISLTSSKPEMVKNVSGWTSTIMRTCLEGMTELVDGGLNEWLEADIGEDSVDDSFPLACEQALERLASALGGKVVLPLVFRYLPSMLASYNWQERHAALMAIGAIMEGTTKTCVELEEMESDIQFNRNELDNVVSLVLPMFNDSHPRVRHAACLCVGRLCIEPETLFAERIVQNRFGRQFFDVLIPALEAPEPRVSSQAAVALSHVCEGIVLDTLLPYLDHIVARLLRLLTLNDIHEKDSIHYVQVQAITTLALVAKASKNAFAKYYSNVMPLLLNILRNAEGAHQLKLRVKALICAGLTATAVGRHVFSQDADALAQLLVRIQTGHIDPEDTSLGQALMTTWAKICQTMGTVFEPYLPVVMPPLINAAKADISVDDEQAHKHQTTGMYGLSLEVPSSVFEEKRQAFEMMTIYCSTLETRFAPYLAQCLELTLSSMHFSFPEGVREACYKLLPLLLYGARMSNILTTDMVSASATQLIRCISSAPEPPAVVSLVKCFITTVSVIGGPAALAQEFHEGLVEVVKYQLQVLANQRKARAQRPASEVAHGLLMIAELENYALMYIAKLLHYLDPKQPLLEEVRIVKDLGLADTILQPLAA